MRAWPPSAANRPEPRLLGLVCQGAKDACRVLDVGILVDHRQHALGGCLGHLQFDEPGRHDLGGPEEVAGEHRERDHGAGADESQVDERAADRQRQVDGHGRDHQHQRQVHRGEHEVAYRGPVHPVGQHAELLGVGVLADEGLAGQDAHDRLVEGSGDLRVGAAHEPGALQDAAVELDRHPPDHRQDRHDEQGEPPVHDQHGPGEADHDREPPDHVHEPPGQDAGQAVAVGGEARHQPAHRTPVEVRERQLLQIHEGVEADVVADVAADPARDPLEAAHGHRDHQVAEQVQPRPEPERRLHAVLLDVVDHPLREQRIGDLHARGGDGRDDQERQFPLVGERIAEQPLPKVELDLRGAVAEAVVELFVFKRHRLPPAGPARWLRPALPGFRTAADRDRTSRPAWRGYPPESGGLARAPGSGPRCERKTAGGR